MSDNYQYKIDEAFEELERNIPLKPLEISSYDDMCVGECPTCRKYVVSPKETCWYCGQALEWRDIK